MRRWTCHVMFQCRCQCRCQCQVQVHCVCMMHDGVFQLCECLSPMQAIHTYDELETLHKLEQQHINDTAFIEKQKQELQDMKNKTKEQENELEVRRGRGDAGDMSCHVMDT